MCVYLPIGFQQQQNIHEEVCVTKVEKKVPFNSQHKTIQGNHHHHIGFGKGAELGSNCGLSLSLV